MEVSVNKKIVLRFDSKDMNFINKNEEINNISLKIYLFFLEIFIIFITYFVN